MEKLSKILKFKYYLHGNYIVNKPKMLVVQFQSAYEICPM